MQAERADWEDNGAMTGRKAAPHKRPTALSAQELTEAADLLRQVIALAKAGDLGAKSPEARALLRRLEGAALAADLAAGNDLTSEA